MMAGMTTPLLVRSHSLIVGPHSLGIATSLSVTLDVYVSFDCCVKFLLEKVDSVIEIDMMDLSMQELDSDDR